MTPQNPIFATRAQKGFCPPLHPQISRNVALENHEQIALYSSKWKRAIILSALRSDVVELARHRKMFRSLQAARLGMPMEFYAVAVVIGIAAAAAIIVPLIRGRTKSDKGADFDLQLYKDQLREIELEAERGGRNAEETAQAKLEVSRRILRADAAEKNERTKSAPRLATRVAAVSIAIALVPGALVLHSYIGQPGMPGLPLAQRLADAAESRANRPSQSEAESLIQTQYPPVDADAEYLALMDELRAAVDERPNEIEGLQLLAKYEATLNNFAAAANAKSKAINLLQQRATADDYAEYAELLIMNVSGYVSPEAETAIFRALELDPEKLSALYYAGLMFTQTGRPDQAFHIWRSLLENAPQDEPWVLELEAQIEQVAPFAGLLPEESPELPSDELPGPSNEEIEAASELTDEERAAMVASMVDGLEERLMSDGGTPEEWARLIRALGVLRQKERADVAYEQAKTAFSGDSAAMKTIESAWQQSGFVND